MEKDMSDSIKLSIIQDIKGFEELKDEWEKLLEQIPNRSIFQTFGWHHNVVKSFKREQEIFMFVFRKGNTLVGILPFRNISRNFRLIKFKVLEFLTHNRSDYQDVILGGFEEECFALFFDYLMKNKRLWDMLYLRNILGKSQNLKMLTHMLDEKGMDIQLQDGIVCPIIYTDKTYEEYIGKRKKKFLSNIRRCKNRLEELGPMKIVRFAGELPLNVLTQELIEQHIKRWNLTETPSKFNESAHREYYKNMFEALYLEGYLDLYYIESNGKRIAFHFGTKFNKKVCFHTPIFDPDFSKFSLNKILLINVIEQTFINNEDCFDFLAGVEQYKYDWTTQEQMTTSLLLFKNSFARNVYNMIYNPDRFKIFSRFKTTL